jgi:hypothetical protein
VTGIGVNGWKRGLVGIIEGKGFEKKQGCLALEVNFRQHLFWKWERYSGYCFEDLGNSDWMIGYDNLSNSGLGAASLSDIPIIDAFEIEESETRKYQEERITRKSKQMRLL